MYEENGKSDLRKKLDEIKNFTCKNLIVVVENPSDWKNIGAVIRNVNALGAEKVYVVDEARKLPEEWQDMRVHKTLFKISASAVKWSFVKRFDDSKSCIEHLKKNGFISYVTSPHKSERKNFNLEACDFTKHKKLALWFGNETTGISDFIYENTDVCVNIPMHGIIESLNLATSTGIVLYETTKQRRAYQNMKRNNITNNS
ncbi:MAG: TrmH family RNA methyltransferase [Gammaproteobacteria bacterium]